MNCSRCATFRTPPTCCGPCTKARGSATATSAWKCLRISLTTRRARSMRRGGLWKAVARENVMIKVPGHSGGYSGSPATAQRRHQHQHYAAVCPGSVRAGSGSLRRGSSSSSRRAAEMSAKWPAWPASSSAASTSLVDSLLDEQIKKESDPARKGQAARDSGQGRHRKRQADLRGLREDLLHAALESPRRKGRADAACALGQHQHEESAYRDVIYVEELIGPDTVNTSSARRRLMLSAITASRARA